MSDRETMPPADPTPPLTAERHEHFRRLIELFDEGVPFRDLLTAYDTLQAQVAQRTAERDALVTFFNGEGAVLGREGDDRHRTPVEQAIVAMRELLARRAALAAPTEG